MRLAITSASLVFGLISACAVYTESDDGPSSGTGTNAVAGRGSGGQSGMLNASGGAKPLGGAGGQKGSQAGTGGSDGSAGDSAAGGVASAGGKPSSGGAPAGAGSGGQPMAGGGGAASACAAPAVATGAQPLIDDFEHLGRAVPANEGRSGVWDVWTKTPSADMFPPSANYQTTGADMAAGYTHWTGTNIGGLNDWGPTLTVQLAGGCPYDASVYSGISLRLRGSAVKQSGAVSQPVPLKVMLWQPQGVPAQDAKGGTCTAPACYNHFSTFVNVPAGWETPVIVPFASLTQGVWTGTVPFAWNPKQLVAIQFQVEVNGLNSELATFDLSIDDLTFVP